jgi:hypothetical protein
LKVAGGHIHVKVEIEFTVLRMIRPYRCRLFFADNSGAAKKFLHGIHWHSNQPVEFDRRLLALAITPLWRDNMRQNGINLFCRQRPRSHLRRRACWQWGIANISATLHQAYERDDHQRRKPARASIVAIVFAPLICPLLSGPWTNLVWTSQEKGNGQEARA